MQDMTEVVDGAPFHNENSKTARFQTYPSTQRRCRIVTTHTSQKNSTIIRHVEEKQKATEEPRFFQKQPEK
jgi:hypothetical protein